MEGNDYDEAYTAIVWGGLLSRESSNPAEAEAVSVAEGNMCGTVKRGAVALSWSKTPSRTKGTRWNLGGLVPDRRQETAPAASGRRGAEADDARVRAVRSRHSSNEADEQSRATGSGAGGAKG